jgi:hypothetical protein
MPDIRAKFYVAEITRYPGDTGGKVVLRVVTRGAINASFASATPTGTIEMHVSNPDAYRRFSDACDRKAEFYIDFTEATPQAGDGHRFVASPAGHYNGDRCAECSGTESEHKTK